MASYQMCIAYYQLQKLKIYSHFCYISPNHTRLKIADHLRKNWIIQIYFKKQNLYFNSCNYIAHKLCKHKPYEVQFFGKFTIFTLFSSASFSIIFNNSFLFKSLWPLKMTILDFSSYCILTCYPFFLNLYKPPSWILCP